MPCLFKGWFVISSWHPRVVLSPCSKLGHTLTSMGTHALRLPIPRFVRDRGENTVWSSYWSRMKQGPLRLLMLRRFSVTIKTKNEIEIILPMARVARGLEMTMTLAWWAVCGLIPAVLALVLGQPDTSHSHLGRKNCPYQTCLWCIFLIDNLCKKAQLTMGSATPGQAALGVEVGGPGCSVFCPDFPVTGCKLRAKYSPLQAAFSHAVYHSNRDSETAVYACLFKTKEYLFVFYLKQRLGK